jgi:hypothetical protein
MAARSRRRAGRAGEGASGLGFNVAEVDRRSEENRIAAILARRQGLGGRDCIGRKDPDALSAR